MALHPAIASMLGRYQCETKQEYKHALKEIIQEVALLGLSRSNFFDHAAFYGGTALRMAHQLDRFSEDLDFELQSKDESFDLTKYHDGIRDELRTFGLRLEVEKKLKSKKDSTIESAFLKGNTIEHLLLIEGLEDAEKGISKNDLIKIRVEVDVCPPDTPPNREIRYHLNPIPFSFRILDLPSLYGGKLHAMICRTWGGGRVRGRDFYDYLWYRRNNISPNFEYFKSKLVQSDKWQYEDSLDERELEKLLRRRFQEIDWQQARSDVEPFIKDPFALQVWSKDFFSSTLD